MVLQITVDQLRADLIDRYRHMMGEGGFAYLLENGAVFTDAHHRHANTETIVGHATLATGTDPAVHGMVGNVWFDRASGERVYNVQDVDYPLIGGSGVDAATEIDPTQRAATTQGRSPRAIITTTISDEIAMHFGPEAKVFGVSVKDRGAISMAGHAGIAYWFSKSDGQMVTSTYYADAYPEWVDGWNTGDAVRRYADEEWSLSRPSGAYLFGSADDQDWETDFPGYGRVFPHPYGPADGKYYTTLLTLSPAGDEIVVDFAKALIDAEDIGQDEVPDFLSVSLSSTDYVGHLFGPSSLEAEDNFGRLDRALADLLAHVDQKVGLDRTLVVLSADHGGPENPGYLAQFGIGGGIIDVEGANTAPALARVKDAFGIEGDLIESFSNPYVYLDQALIAESDADPGEVAAAVAAELRALPGVDQAITSDALSRGAVAAGPVSDAVLANFHPERSGDIYIVFQPHWFIADFDGLSVAATHGSPWAYDTHVPVILAGPGIPPGRIARRVETVDLAPTIAAYLGTGLPSGTRGRLLVEVLTDEKQNPE